MGKRKTGFELTLFDDYHNNDQDYHDNDDDRNYDHSEMETTNRFEQRERVDIHNKLTTNSNIQRL